MQVLCVGIQLQINWGKKNSQKRDTRYREGYAQWAKNVLMGRGQGDGRAKGPNGTMDRWLRGVSQQVSGAIER